MVYGLVRCHYNNDDALFFGEGGEVSAWQMSQMSQHMQLSSLNDKRHKTIISINDKHHITTNVTGFFLHKNDKRHNVTMFGVMMSYFCFEHVHIKLWCYLALRHHFLLPNILQYTVHVNSSYIHQEQLKN